MIDNNIADENKLENVSEEFKQIILAVTAITKDEDWLSIDEKISQPQFLTAENVRWAIHFGLNDTNRNIRDLAATILDNAEPTLSEKEIELLKTWMERDQYDIVRYRLAIALFKNGSEDNEVKNLFNEALKNESVGKIAEKILNEKK